MSMHRKTRNDRVCTADENQYPVARPFRGYYDLAVKRRPNAQFWFGVFSEPVLQDLEGMELVVGDVIELTDSSIRFGRIALITRRQPTLFVERVSHMGEIVDDWQMRRAVMGPVR